MKVIQVVSGDIELIDFAVSSSPYKSADIYTMHVSSLKKPDLHEKINKYVTLTDPDTVWDKLKKETKTDDMVDDELFNIIAAFLKGSKRGRSTSVFDELETTPRKKRKTTKLNNNNNNNNDDDNNGLRSQHPLNPLNPLDPNGNIMAIIISMIEPPPPPPDEIDSDDDDGELPIEPPPPELNQAEQFHSFDDLINTITNNAISRDDRGETGGNGNLINEWENMTAEELDIIDRAYEEEIRNDPDYDPVYDDPNYVGSCSDSERTESGSSSDSERTESGSSSDSE